MSALTLQFDNAKTGRCRPVGVSELLLQLLESGYEKHRIILGE